jgi:hypothetical protein
MSRAPSASAWPPGAWRSSRRSWAPRRPRWSSRASAGARARRCTRSAPRRPAVYLPATACLWADDLEAAIRRLTQILGEARRRGSVSGFVDASHFRAIAWWRRGALLEVEADARNALDQGAPYAIPIGAVALADVLIERGQLAAAESILGDAGSAPPGLVTSFALEVLARLRIAQRRPDDALEVLFDRRQARGGVRLHEHVELLALGRRPAVARRR